MFSGNTANTELLVNHFRLCFKLYNFPVILLYWGMRIVEVTKDGCIVFTPLDMEELKILPGEKYVLERNDDAIILTPLDLLPAQE